MTTSRRSLGSLLSAPLYGLLRGLRRLFPGLDSTRTLQRSEQVLDDLRLELGRAIASRHLANKRLGELQLRHAELHREIEGALEAGREDSARARVSEQLTIEAHIDGCRRTMREATALERDLEQALGALLRARREFADSMIQADGAPAAPTWGEDPAERSLTDARQLTHERRVQERLRDLKSRRPERDAEAGGSAREHDKE
jgi:phage shock protein A